MSSGNDAVEELTSLAELHDDVDGLIVLVGFLQSHDIIVGGKLSHDLHLAADVFHVDGCPEFLL